LTDWPPGYGLARHEELDSTSSEARRLAEAGETGPIWITTSLQTAGRGRRGRVWVSPNGNLAATLLLRPKRPIGVTAQLSFAAALAVSDITAELAPDAVVTVRWPNDVLADGRKLAGILLESGPGWLTVGIGINLAAFPDSTEFPATSLAAVGVTPLPPDVALTMLAARFDHWYVTWMRDGFGPLRTVWLSRAQGLGHAIRVRLPLEEHHGVFEGIDEQGALLLNEQGKVRIIAAGEVFF
jgi:BirA family biotin operon repressor/biotin-[acetyl-CoA-carboxylase] ligase